MIAIGASFVSALVVVRPFVRFLQNHSFVPFAWYRILVGAVVFLWLV
ncbi:MAG: undecaprenyl-diphosphate phosphatase [Planctomycetota bacterium]